MLELIYTILIGFVVGLLARFLKPGKDKMGFLLTSLLGIGGAFVATYVGNTIGLYEMGEPAGFIASVLGAVSILVIVKLIKS